MKKQNYKKHTLGAIIMLFIFIAFSLVPESANSDSFQQNVDAHIEKADAFYLEGKYTEALNEANKAIALNPNDARGYNYITAVHIAQGDYKRAIDSSEVHLSVLEASDSIDVNIIVRHATLIEKTKGYQETILFLKKYQRMFPRTVERDIEGLKKANSEGRNYYKFSP